MRILSMLVVVGLSACSGTTGPRGPQGDQGAKGETGATGAQGPIGVAGPRGATGGGLYVAATDAYCVSAARLGIASVDAYCVDDAHDLLLTGGCSTIRSSGSDLVTVLTTSAPAFRGGTDGGTTTQTDPVWQCQWTAADPGAVGTIQNTEFIATVCCVRGARDGG